MYITFLCPSISSLCLCSSHPLPLPPASHPSCFFSPPLLNLLHTPSYCPPLYSSLVLKYGTTLLYINLLFIQMRINLPAILPYYRHWDNLATNILSLHTLHS